MLKSNQSPLIIENLTFAYPEQKQILTGINLTIEKGEKVAILGRTGAGKSTLLENLIGLKIPDSGNIFIQGLKLEKKNLKEIRKRVGFAFQNPEDQLFMPTILEDVMFGLLNYEVPRLEAKEKGELLLDKFGLIEYRNKSVHQLSGGQKRLVALASILALEPAILILDEPTNGLDPAWRRELAQVLLKLPIEVLLIASHDLNWIKKITTRTLLLNQGQIVVDKPTLELLKSGSILADYGLPLDW
ncbi:MAG TPA: ABC transporter ATP-binding protein [Allocoleopsis sp.]